MTLNKRVAFPLHNVSNSNSSVPSVDPTAPLPNCNISTLPPPPAGTFSSFVGKLSSDEEAVANTEDHIPLNVLETVTNNLNGVLSEIFANKEKVTEPKIVVSHVINSFLTILYMLLIKL